MRSLLVALSAGLAVSLFLLAGCSNDAPPAALDDGGSQGAGGAQGMAGQGGGSGSGQAGQGEAGSGQAGQGQAGSGQAGGAGSGQAGSGQAGSGQAGGPDDAAFAGLMALTQKTLSQSSDLVGASVAVVVDGSLAYSGAAGVRHHGGQDPVTTHSRFDIGSISKMMTAAATLSLAKNKGFTVDDTLASKVDGFALAKGADTSALTLKHLLTHTSGIDDMPLLPAGCPKAEGQMGAFYKGYSPAALVAPGTVWNYSNTNFGLLGWLIEQQSGGTYEDAMASLVFGPAMMTETTFDAAAAKAGDLAYGWYTSQQAEVSPDLFWCNAARPFGGVLATASDVALFAASLLGGALSDLGPSMWTGYTETHYETLDEQYGYGFFLFTYKGLQVAIHHGDVPGYHASVWVVPDRKFAAVSLHTGDALSPDIEARGAVDLFLKPTGKTSPGTRPPADWTSYVGTYQDPTKYGQLIVSLSPAGDLLLDAPSEKLTAGKLIPVSGDTFALPWSATQGAPLVTFYPDTSGTFSYFVTRDGVGTRQP